MSKSLRIDRVNQAFELFKQMNSLPNYFSENLFLKPIKNITLNDFDVNGFQSSIEVAMAFDYKYYLQDDILTKIDRATMSVSLEGREPFLDHRIIEYAAQLPIEYKLNNGVGKRILKDIVYEYVPKDIMDRPKTGFSVPIYSWLKNDLSYLLDEYLNENAIAKSGLFNVDFVVSLVKDFKNDKLRYTPLIWKILMFQMWYSKWMN
jgi:asparagine synthase (glutamine-hydrolysing)